MTRNAATDLPQSIRHRARLLAYSILAIAVALSIAGLIVHAGLVRYLDWPIHLLWMQGYADALAQGEWPPRWIAAANGGYGAPIFVFYPPLAYCLATPVVWWLGAAAGLKFVYMLAQTLFAYFTYRWLRRFAGRVAAALAVAVAVLSIPALLFAHRWNMPAGLLGFAFVPAVLWRLGRMQQPTAGSIVALALAWCVLVLAHLPTAYMLGLPVAPALMLHLVKRETRRGSWYVVAALLLGSALSAFYWLPAMGERSLVHTEYALSAPWDWHRHLLFAGAIASNDLSSQLSVLEACVRWLVVCSLIAATICLVVRWRRINVSAGIGLWIGSALALGGLLLMTPATSLLYEHVPGMKWLQFPWRWLWALSLGCALLWAQAWDGLRAGVTTATRLLGHAMLMVPAVMLIGQGLVLQGWFSHRDLPPVVWVPDPERTVAEQALPVDTYEHRPLTMGQMWRADLRRDAAPELASDYPLRSERVFASPHRRAWHYISSGPQSVRLRLLAYPGWRAYIDDVEIPITTDSRDGAIRLSLSSGEHSLDLRFESTPLRLWAGALSILSMASVFAMILSSRRKRRMSWEHSHA